MALPDFKALGAKAAAEGKDMTQASAGGGGDYAPPAAGPCRLRFIGYVEGGKHKGSFQGKATNKEQAWLIFEVSGKAYPPTVSEDGTVHPIRITCKLDKSLNEKAHFFKLFQRMNYKQQAKHIAELLGEAFKGEIVHRKWLGKQDGKERIEAELFRKGDGYTIAPPRVEDDEAEGGYRTMEVAPAISPIRCFLWDYADMDQWASLFIDGAYPERKDAQGKVIAPAKSKNTLQNFVKTATNFEGSPIHQLLVAGGVAIDIPDAEDPAEGNESSAATPAASPSTTSPSEQVTALAAGGADALSGIC